MGLGAATVYYVNGSGADHKVEPITDLNDQTIELSHGEGRVNRAFGSTPMTTPFEEVKTLYQSFRRGARESNNGDCLGWRQETKTGHGPYVWMTYNDVIKKAEFIAAGFLACGLEPGQNTFVGLYAVNRPEWVITEQACYVYSHVVVPLYDTLGPDACTYIINQADIKIVICDTSKKGEGLLDKIDGCPGLKNIVVMDAPSESLKSRGAQLGVSIYTLDEMEQMGASQNRLPAQPPNPEDLSTLCYTSGTTGTPKGVMLTHANIIADCTCFSVLKRISLNKDDSMMSFLPLAHMFERLIEAVMFMTGAKVGFYRGDIKHLSDDIKELRPTVIPVVPRLMNRIYDKVMSEVAKSSMKRTMFRWAMNSKDRELKRGVIRDDSIWDRLVFKKVREGLGGRVRFMCTGSAPVAENVLNFFRAALGCVVVEGYGQTECVACCCVTIEGDHTAGHVGPPIPCNRIKLVDVPEMNYFAKDRVGEVCIKGPNVFKGYFKDPEKTKEAIDDQGWLHTGDVGRWTAQGTLKLIDRKKHIFKLSQGEYVAPEKIEIVYMRSKFVAQCFVYGESLKSCLVAIVVPDVEVLPKYCAKEMDIKGSMEELCNNPRVKKLIMDDMTTEGKKGGLFSFEQVKDITLCHESFSVENGLLTPTFKSKRPVLKEFFGDAIAQMYKVLI